MIRHRATRIVGTLLMMGLPMTARAQISVIDEINAGINSNTSLQSTISAVQSVLLVADSALNLIGINGVTSQGEYQQQQQAMQDIFRNTDGLAYDIATLQRQINRLLHLQNATDSTYEYRRWREEIRQIQSAQRRQSFEVQTTVNTAIRIGQRIGRILNDWSRIAGNLSATQQSNNLLDQIAQLEQSHYMADQVYQRAETFDKAIEPMEEQIIQNVTNAVLADWPTR